MDDISEIIWKPYNLDILILSDGKNTIQDITNKTGLSYKSVFLRIKELKEVGILESNATKHSSQKMIISKRFNDKLKNPIQIFQHANLELQNKEADILPLLKRLLKKRLVGSHEFFDGLDPLSKAPFMVRSLEDSGYIKRRFDITKKGIKFLNNYKEAKK